jgi:hypothetical protein
MDARRREETRAHAMTATQRLRRDNAQSGRTRLAAADWVCGGRRVTSFKEDTGRMLSRHYALVKIAGTKPPRCDGARRVLHWSLVARKISGAAAPGPHSSADRAPASGAGCGRSSRPGGAAKTAVKRCKSRSCACAMGLHRADLRASNGNAYSASDRSF